MNELKTKIMNDHELTEVFVVKKEFFELPLDQKLLSLDLIKHFINDQSQKITQEMKEKKEQDLLDVLNKIIENSQPIKYSDFNVLIKEKEKGAFEALEKEEPRIGLRAIDYQVEKGFCMSTLSLIATITDVILGKRLAFKINNKDEIEGVLWYKEKKQISEKEV